MSREDTRMLLIHAFEGNWSDRTVADLPNVLLSGDLLVVNDAATLPASLRAYTAAGASIEIRLVRHIADSDWLAVLLGHGDWRIPTELRDEPEPVSVGSILEIAADFSAEVMQVSPESGRMVTIRFRLPRDSMWSAIYAHARPIQYSYLARDLPLWSVQTTYASRPWAVEMPSAGLPLTWRVLLELRRRGVGVTWLTHGAGLSAVGDEDIDRNLPLPERFDIPQCTVDAIDRTHRESRRVIAVGTTVVRALEGCASMHDGRLVAGAGATDLVIDRNYRLSVVDSLVTGVHDPAQSHFRLLRAFAGETTLRRAWRHAAAAGYVCHEFGDVCLIL